MSAHRRADLREGAGASRAGATSSRSRRLRREQRLGAREGDSPASLRPSPIAKLRVEQKRLERDRRQRQHLDVAALRRSACARSGAAALVESLDQHVVPFVGEPRADRRIGEDRSHGELHQSTSSRRARASKSRAR
jgi:hypothetical protein